MKQRNSYSPELRERAVRLVLDQHGEPRFTVGGDHFGVVEDRLCAGDAISSRSTARCGRSV